MSLVNKVLTDLAARDREQTEDPLIVDLRPVPTIRPRPIRRTVWVIGAIALLAGGSLIYWIIGDGSPPASEKALPDAAPPSSPAPEASPGTAEETEEVSAADHTVTFDAESADTPTAAASARQPAGNAPPPSAVARQRPAPSPAASSPNRVAETGSVDAPTVAPETRVSKTSRTRSPRALAEDAYAAAQRLLGEGRLAEAEDRLRRALAADPGHIQARETLVSQLVQSQRFAEAAAVLEAGTRAAPEHPLFYQWLARLYVQDGAELNAIALLESGFAYGEDDPEYLGFMGALYQRVARYGDAKLAYEAALRLQPDQGKWWLGLALAFEGQQDWAAARAAYQRAASSPHQTPELARFARSRLTALTTTP